MRGDGSLPRSPTLAEAAMDTLRALRTHAEQCRQCRVDAGFCDTATRYRRNFEQDYERWLTARRVSAA